MNWKTTESAPQSGAKTRRCLTDEKGFAVLADSQFLPGYCILPHTRVNSLNDLDTVQRLIFLRKWRSSATPLRRSALRAQL